MPQARKLLAASILLLLAAATTPGSPASASSQFEARVSEAIRFRADFGLALERTKVEASLQDESLDSAEWGVPLSSSELEDLEERGRVRDAIEPVLEIAASLEGDGGAFVDQQRHGLPVLLTTNPLDLASAIAEKAAPGLNYEIRSVQHSLAQLRDVQGEIVRKIPDLGIEQIEIVAVGLDIINNRVSVGVLSSVSAASERLAREFGDVVSVRADRPSTFDACTNMTNCWPMKGGLRIYLTGASGVPCTSGFLAKRSDTLAIVAVTAGHCLALYNKSGTDYWGHNSSPSGASNFGYELGQTWYDYSTADIGLIQLDAGAVSDLTAKNQVHSADPGVNEDVLELRSQTYQDPGDPVCRMGWGTWNATGQGKTCGIVGTNVDVVRLSCQSGLTVNCKHITRSWEVSFDSLPGDSGGPVWLKSYGSPYPHLVAYGTHVHSGSGSGAVGWYSPVTIGIGAYGYPLHNYSYSICTAASC